MSARKKIVVGLVSVAFLSMVSTIAQAESVFKDSFSSANVDTSKWKVTYSGSGDSPSGVTIDNGAAHIVANNGTEYYMKSVVEFFPEFHLECEVYNPSSEDRDYYGEVMYGTLARHSTWRVIFHDGGHCEIRTQIGEDIIGNPVRVFDYPADTWIKVIVDTTPTTVSIQVYDGDTLLGEVTDAPHIILPAAPITFWASSPPGKLKGIKVDNVSVRGKIKRTGEVY